MSTTTPARSPAADRLDGFKLLVAIVALMWAVEVVDSLDHHDLDQYGIKARVLDGLVGIVTGPFLHVSWDHLIANTVPFVCMGLAIALGGAARVLAVTAIVAFVGGLGTWLIAPDNSVTVGASGVVFGYASYLLTRGVFNRSLLELAIGLVVGVVWGGVLLTGFVPRYGISWQGHACGAIGGIVAAWLLARRAAHAGGAPTRAAGRPGPSS